MQKILFFASLHFLEHALDKHSDYGYGNLNRNKGHDGLPAADVATYREGVIVPDVEQNQAE